MEECETCHEEITRDFKTSDHARLQAKGENAPDLGCEGCHGPGSLHVESGGGAGTIVNPRKSPETCFNCHLDVKAQFNLPYAHPVLSGKMSCSDCHDPHKGSVHERRRHPARRPELPPATQCHTQQQGPFVFEHEATREGCASCHSPHGSTEPEDAHRAQFHLVPEVPLPGREHRDPDRQPGPRRPPATGNLLDRRLP